MLKSIIFEGKIPHVPQVKQVLNILAWFLPFSVFLMPYEFGSFGSIGFWALVYVLCMGQLAFMFPQIKLFESLLMFRGQFGVFSGMMIVAHFAGYLLVNEIGIGEFINNDFVWNPQGFTFWGVLGFLSMLPVLVTSNKFSMDFLGKWWKRVQKLAYLFLIFGAIHIVMSGEGSAIAGVAIVIIMRILKKVNFQVKV